MAEPPSSWELPDDDNASVAGATFKLGGLNVNAMEFVPTFGMGASAAPKPSPVVTQPAVPKTPPSTPVVTRNTTEDEKKQTEPVIKPPEVKEPVTTTTTAADVEFDDLLDEESES